MVLLVVAVVEVLEMITSFKDVHIHVVRLNVYEQTVCVRHNQFDLITPCGLCVVVPNVVHHNFGQVQNGISKINGFVQHHDRSSHSHGGQVFRDDVEGLVVCLSGQIVDLLFRSGHPHIHTVSDVLHRLTEYRIVHKLQEVLFRFTLHLFTFIRVLCNIRF